MLKSIHDYVHLSVLLLLIFSGGCETRDQVRDQLTMVPEGVHDPSGSFETKGDHSLSYEAAWAELPKWSETIGLETLFAPDDPTAHLEVSLIDKVILACQNDDHCHPQQRPSQYNIRYEVYNLTDRLLIQKLIEDFKENKKCNCKNDASDEEYSTFNWEEATASKTIKSLWTALAKAA